MSASKKSNVENVETLVNKLNKSEIEYSSLSVEQKRSIADFTKSQSKTSSNANNFLYRCELEEGKKLSSSERKRFRNQRNKHIANFYASNTKEEKTNSVASFEKWYKETYLLNDYSINSICGSSTSFGVRANVEIFLLDIRSLLKK